MYSFTTYLIWSYMIKLFHHAADCARDRRTAAGVQENIQDPPCGPCGWGSVSGCGAVLPGSIQDGVPKIASSWHEFYGLYIQIYIYIDIFFIIYMYIYIYLYETTSKFVLIKYALGCSSDVGCCMKPAETMGDSQKTVRFLIAHACAFGGVAWGLLRQVVFSNLDLLHHEWVCRCGGLTLHDFTLLQPPMGGLLKRGTE